MALEAVDERGQRVPGVLQPVEGRMHRVGGTDWLGGQVVDDEDDDRPREKLSNSRSPPAGHEGSWQAVELSLTQGNF
jgi:hypothetical protein